MGRSLSLRRRVGLICAGLALGVLAAFPLLRMSQGRSSAPGAPDAPRYVPEYAEVEDGFGIVPRAGVEVRSTRHAGDQLLYDVTYTIGEDGLRVTPGAAAAADGEAIVLFGGSFTFGEGVEDDETFAAQLARALPTTPVRNAGFHGYGPHQMLRALETDRLDADLPSGVRDVVYLALEGHEARVGGRVDWALSSPRYRRGAEGLQSDGEFVSGLSLMAVRALRHLGLRDALNRWLAPSEQQRAEDLDLLAAIVARSQELAAQKWQARFTVLFWGIGEEIPQRLEAAGVRVVRLSELSAGTRWWEEWVIPIDGHPAPSGHRRIAEVLLAELGTPADEPAGAPGGAPGSALADEPAGTAAAASRDASGLAPGALSPLPAIP